MAEALDCEARRVAHAAYLRTHAALKKKDTICATCGGPILQPAIGRSRKLCHECATHRRAPENPRKMRKAA